MKGREPKVAVKHELGTKHRAALVCVTSNNTFLTPVSTSHHISIRQAPSFTASGGNLIGGRPRQRCDDIGGQRTLLQRGTGWRQGDGRAAAEREDA